MKERIFIELIMKEMQHPLISLDALRTPQSRRIQLEGGDPVGEYAA